MTKITAIADLHGYKPLLSGGDLLLLAGDYTASDKKDEWSDFFKWLKEQPYKKKILVAGNHDRFLENSFESSGFDYLWDSGTEFDGLKIWGSPWTQRFPGQNPQCTAFTKLFDDHLQEKWGLIPSDTDILVTHCPPYGIFDQTTKDQWVGSRSLREHVIGRVKPMLHVFGHIHECGGRSLDTTVTTFVNCAYLDEHYQIHNQKILDLNLAAIKS